MKPNLIVITFNEKKPFEIIGIKLEDDKTYERYKLKDMIVLDKPLEIESKLKLVEKVSKLKSDKCWFNNFKLQKQLIKKLYNSLTEKQKANITKSWDIKNLDELYEYLEFVEEYK